MRTGWIILGIVCVGVALFIVAVSGFISWNVATGNLPLLPKLFFVALGIAITYFLFATLSSVRASYRVRFADGSADSVVIWRRRANRAWLVMAVILITFAIVGLTGGFQ